MSLFFDLWFMRAGNYPLSITINCGEDTDAFARLSVYFPRCKTIELAADFTGINNILVPLPSLRKLNIHVENFRATPFLTFPNAPELEELRLSNSFMPFTQLRLGVPSTVLTRLDMSYRITLQECLDILQHFPQLLHFSVFQDTDIEKLVHTRRTSESPIFHLESLELMLNTDLLALVTLPHLRRLTIGPRHNDQLLTFLSRSSVNITRFHITFDWHSIDNALRLCLQAVPNVSVLRIRLCGPAINSTVSDLHALDQPNIFPSLHILHIQDYGPRSVLHTQAYLLLMRCFRALSARGVRVHVESASLSLPADLKLDESVGGWLRPCSLKQHSNSQSSVAEVEADPDNPFPPMDFF
jgi:hypothetical protein